MSTVRDLVNGALKDLGVLAAGETASADVAEDARLLLNDLLGSWSTDNLTIYQRTPEEFPLVAGQSSYTIGTGGNFNTARPIEVESANYKSAGREYPITIFTPKEWSEISDKSRGSSLPQGIFLLGTYPLDTILIYPVPDGTASLVLYTLKPLTTFATINTTFSLPEGYPRALRTNLAVELAPSYGREPSSTLMSAAMDSKAGIKRKNIKTNLLKVDAALLTNGNRFNFLRGY